MNRSISSQSSGRECKGPLLAAGGGVRTATLRRFSGRLGAWLTAACVGLSLMAGCEKAKTPLKQDTPQATVASVVRVLAAADDSQWPALIDPELERAEARWGACLDAVILEPKCKAAQMQDFMAMERNGFRGGTHVDKPAGCPVYVQPCMCAGPGVAAASTAKDFPRTDAYAFLKARNMSPERCTISDAQPLDEKKVGASSGHFFDLACDDLGKADPFASVQLVCGKTERVGFILHLKDAKWSVVGFNDDTNFSLRGAADGARVKAEQEQRAKDLNKDMK